MSAVDNRLPDSILLTITRIWTKWFLERTDEKGLVCGWTPQVAVLAHHAIGGFVFHSGWNSVFERMYRSRCAEQKLNMFELVKDLRLAVEMSMDYREGGGDLVLAEEVERGVRSVMDCDNEVRKRVKEMGEKSRKALMEGGSSFVSL